MRIMPFWQAIGQTIYGDSTRPVRLILALVEIFFVLYLVKESSTEQFEKMLGVAGVWAWATCFSVHCATLFYGLTGRYSKLTMMIEGVFGMGLWWITAITHWGAQGYPGPTLVCAIAQTIIWANYPTHRDWEGEE